mmetsp:Transcript_1683/g.10329  ORF Transcript_1683/g.10329 Transcript_1683/m.10329 type:complete len:92 (-) Transcript_1683:1559-1834(-)
MITAREIVNLVTPPIKEPAPTRAITPGSIHCQAEPGRYTPGGAPGDPQPFDAAKSTVASPTILPTQAPIKSMGTNNPDEIALPAIQQAPAK